MRYLSAVFVLLSVASSFAQVATSRLDGTVTDAQGAIVPGAQVQVLKSDDNQTFRTKTDEKGYWVVASLPSSVYRITVTLTGFKTASLQDVQLDAGVPATVNVTLQVGALTDTIEVTSGAEIVQTDTAQVSSTLQGKQIHDLPFTSHNATELIATQPGTQTPLAVRTSTINGLPQSAINITMDGINIQDNTLKSTDGVFNTVQPRIDAIEEMTMTTAAAGADNLGEGAVQIRFVTRSGTNEFHGGLFEQNRNSYFSSNYYFNSVNGLARDRLNLNQFGGRIGGPIVKNKLFFFNNFEAFRLPQSFTLAPTTWLTPAATTGIFTYKDTAGKVQSVNLYQLAATGNQTLPSSIRPFPTTPDATLQKTYALIQQLTGQGGQVSSRIATNNDYNRESYSFAAKALNNRNFETAKLDYNINEKHHLSFVWNYQTNLRLPDGLNSTLAILPGTGTVLGSPSLEGQTGIYFSGVFALRSVITSTLTNELTAGLVGGTSILGKGLSAADYGLWNGYQTSYAGYMSNPYNGSFTGLAPRNAPVKQITDNATKQLGTHVLNFGGDFTQINYWQAASNSSLLNTIALGQAAGDPDNTGATSLFTSATLPGSSAAQQSDASNLYALLVGRVLSTTSSAVLNEQTKKYGPNYTIDRDQQREFALFVQDSWRFSPSLTLNYGLRYDKQFAFSNSDGIYSTVSFPGLYGISGAGNLFQPGNTPGQVPTYTAAVPGQGLYSPKGAFNPTVGFAYKIAKQDGFLSWITGKGDAVIRGGFSISTIREGMGTYSAIFGANLGRSLVTSTSPTTTPTQFPAGSILFRDGTYPALLPTSIDPAFPNTSYPIAAQNGQTVNGINPNIKPEYVESWNFGFQRELDHNTVVEVRYVGNHGVGLWRTVNLNEPNINENGFLTQFQGALNNLNIARQTNATSTNFSNQGLPGQVNVPILTTAIGTSDQTTATQLLQGQAGATANAIATNATRMGALTKAGYPANLFVANPIFANANLLTNASSSSYHSGQVEVRRRMSHGLQVQGSYAFSKSLQNATNFTLRNIGGEKGPTPFDIRNALKVTAIYQLPLGHGRLREGWEFSGVGRLQSGIPINLQSGRMTINANDSGVVLHNITASQLQSEMGIYKTSNVSANGAVTGTAWYLPQPLIQNTLAAFALGGTLDPNAPYIGPAQTAGQEGSRIFLYGPAISKWDISLVKTTKIREKLNVEFRVQALNIFNFTNFELPAPTGGQPAGTLNVGTSFGQTAVAFRDFNNTNDPGSRTVEFVLRLNF
jgi:hypothetical protein